MQQIVNAILNAQTESEVYSSINDLKVSELKAIANHLNIYILGKRKEEIKEAIVVR